MSLISANPKYKQKLTKWIPTFSDSTKIDLLVRLLDVAIKASSHFPIISLTLTSLNVLLAVHDFLSNNIGYGILNSIFVITGLIFLLQMHLMNKSHHSGTNPNGRVQNNMKSTGS